ncbi:hypothetical protein ANO11243_024250 [Dothideomycetidae sp. 11243]|nr:hypothetical protein ANO11243_024250 [fungal sp. No.11243]
MTRLAIDSLPAEVLELIASTLYLDDLRNVRLSSARFAAKFSGARFQSFYRCKTVVITSPAQLEEFVQRTRSDQYGRLVQTLTLRGILPAENGSIDVERYKDVATTLAVALNNIRSNSVTGRLPSLTLEAGYDNSSVENPRECRSNDPNARVHQWHYTWYAAEWTFATVCNALATSGLPIDELDIFHGMYCCSLACDSIQPVLDIIDLSLSLGGLKRLSLSLSSCLRVRHDSGGHGGQQVSRLLGFCPALQSLELHWYKTKPVGEALSASPSTDMLFFDTICRSVRLPQLRCLALRGIFMTQAALMEYLSHTAPISSLILEEATLSAGSYAPVFAAVGPSLDHLHLDMLYCAGGLQQFFGPGSPPFPTEGRGPRRPFHLTRRGAEARAIVKYESVNGYALDSGAHHSWLKLWRLRYGPPPDFRTGHSFDQQQLHWELQHQDAVQAMESWAKDEEKARQQRDHGEEWHRQGQQQALLANALRGPDPMWCALPQDER